MLLTVVNEYSKYKDISLQFAQSNGFTCVDRSNTDEQANLNLATNTPFLLRFTQTGIYLTDCRSPKPVDIYVDFVQGQNAHRRRYGGGRGQAIAKAVGVDRRRSLTVLDTTAGLGKDAFVLANLGCRVDMIERSPIAFQLLNDGLNRANHHAMENDQPLLGILANMKLVYGNSLEWLNTSQQYDVIYIDPMFPESKKTAKVKKDMQAFHQLIGSDRDADILLERAIETARYRVVVKRPKHAPHLANKKCNYQLLGKSTRFDIYALRSMD